MSLTSRLINTVSTKRAEVASGKRQNPTTNLTGLKATNLWPADPGRAGQLLEAGLLQGLLNVFETIVGGRPDVRPGDLLVFGGVEYAIRGAALWPTPAGGDYFTLLTVEKILQ